MEKLEIVLKNDQFIKNLFICVHLITSHPGALKYQKNPYTQAQSLFLSPLPSLLIANPRNPSPK